MGAYRQYCPIARASEILAERWTPLVVRNLMFGAHTFSDLAKGVPAMSRSMLIKRLEHLERSGIVVKEPKATGPGHLYHLTPAGEDLHTVITSLGVWGERWVDVTTEHADPGFALWAWAQVQVDHNALPKERTVVAFVFPDETPANRYYWLLVDHGEAEVCYSDPGGDPDATVTAESLAFTNWHRGSLRWKDAIGNGAIAITGRRDVARAVPSWNTHAPVLEPT
ncbi:MAG: winged helix-turn-helix transcriptional regulator [Acidimicrobiales bacterium]